MPDPTDPRAVAAQPALGYDPDCPECKGTGQRDSGGVHPWGEPAMMTCDCDTPPVVDDPSGIVQQMPEGGYDLKSCPFCGSDAAERTDGPYFLVYCRNCGAEQSSELRRVSRSAWNRRATPADLRAEVDRLRQALRPFAEVTILPTGAVVGLDRFWFDRARAALSPETDGGQDG